MARPSVDVVVPVAGDVDGVLRRMEVLALHEGDTLSVVDNRGAQGTDSRVIVATEQRSSYYARNRGAERGRAPWLVFLDADVEPQANLLDGYFEAPPGADTAVLAGGIVDSPGRGWAERYALVKGSMSQETTLAHGEWSFAQTANCAVRRDAFEAVGGFREGIRSGGDADLCFRLRAAGWALESRPEAAVIHHNRSSVPALLGQRFRHGSGAAWLGKEHPGALPARRWPGLAWWSARRTAAGLRALARRDRDAAIEGLLDGLAVWAFELGRLVPNRPFRSRRSLGRGRAAGDG